MSQLVSGRPGRGGGGGRPTTRRGLRRRGPGRGGRRAVQPKTWPRGGGGRPTTRRCLRRLGRERCGLTIVQSKLWRGRGGWSHLRDGVSEVVADSQCERDRGRPGE